MIKKVLLGLLFVVGIFIIVVALQPGEFSVSRSATIPASPEMVFAQVNDLHKFNEWNPWAKIDPSMKQRYEGPESGVGQSYAWDGNGEVGAGKMTIVESQPNEHVGVKLEFFRPMEGVNDTDFTLQPEGDGTMLTWSMHGEVSFVAKAFHLFMDIDKMIGDNYEKGLSDLKQIVAQDNAAEAPETNESPPVTAADETGSPDTTAAERERVNN